MAWPDPLPVQITLNEDDAAKTLGRREMPASNPTSLSKPAPRTSPWHGTQQHNSTEPGTSTSTKSGVVQSRSFVIIQGIRASLVLGW
jgi:hypothetical protein